MIEDFGGKKYKKEIAERDGRGPVDWDKDEADLARRRSAESGGIREAHYTYVSYDNVWDILKWVWKNRPDFMP